MTFAAGCGDDDESCGVTGMTVSCACPGGGTGAQECLADGTFGACDCGGGPADMGPGDMETPLACGDGTCGADETAASCPADCEGCGDGTCGADEDPSTCADDCPVTCGDGFCDTGETADACADDCICDPFDLAASSCDPNATCVPDIDGMGSLTGSCQRAGTLADGASCEGAAIDPCGPGLRCVYGVCRHYCDIYAADPATAGCEATEVCFDGLFSPPFGACTDPCTTFSTDGCDSGQWCAPGFFSTSACRDVGAGTADDDCTSAADCAEFHYCQRGRCRLICDPTTTAGCDAGELCVASEAEGMQAQFGSCIDECSTVGSTAECPAGETCVAAELSAWENPTCGEVPGLATGAACPMLGDSEPCNELALCLVPSGGGPQTCVGICRASEGAIGGAHSDCDALEDCVDIGVPDFGLCIVG